MSILVEKLWVYIEQAGTEPLTGAERLQLESILGNKSMRKAFNLALKYADYLGTQVLEMDVEDLAKGAYHIAYLKGKRDGMRFLVQMVLDQLEEKD